MSRKLRLRHLGLECCKFLKEGHNNMMNKWIPFSLTETNTMGASAKPLEDNSERKCSSCGELSVRWYYREISIYAGVSWFWCARCHKYQHSRITPLSRIYEFNDPIFGFPEKQGNKWFEYLDYLWDEGVLPQVFRRKD